MQWQKITIAGVGLLGGSLGLILREKKAARQVVGFVRRPESIGECLQRGVVDEATTDLSVAVRGSDLVILCTPIKQMPELVRQMAPHLEQKALLTDVGSVKAELIASINPLLGKSGARYVGSHPMAGAEKMGVAAARADLFQKSVCVVTPGPETSEDHVQRVCDFWKLTGARPVILDPLYHDELVSRSSHLPHLIAAALVNQVLFPGHPKEQEWLCATGFRDTTRVASGSPEMWRDIVISNRKNVARALDLFLEELKLFKALLEVGDSERIEEFFSTAKRRRDAWTGQSRSPE